MSAEYDLYKINGGVEKENEGMYRARLVSKGTITTDKLISEIVSRTSFSPGDASGMIASITDVVLHYLEEGHDVQLGNLGYFSVSLKSRVVESKKDIHAQSVWFNRLNFRIGREALKRLKWMTVERVSLVRARSADYSLEKKEGMLRKYLETHPFVTRAAYADLTRSLRQKAITDLNLFIEKGWLCRYGSGRTVVYYLNKE